MKKYYLLVLVFTNIASLVLVSVLFTQFRAQSENLALAQQNLEAGTLKVPADAVKISECIPFEGEHYVQPAKLPLGPIYVVYEGKVTGIEFMFKADSIPGEMAAKMSPEEADAMIKKNNLKLSDLVIAHDFKFDMLNGRFTSMAMNWSMPHSGLAEPHYDIHAYTVNDVEAKQICPDAKLEDVYSSQVMENITKYKIPFPQAPVKK